MSVKRIHTNAMGMRSAKTPLAPMPVRVAQDSKEVDCRVMTSMSAPREVIFATFMPAVLTCQALTAAPVEKASLEMDDIVQVSAKSTISLVKHLFTFFLMMPSRLHSFQYVLPGLE